MDAEKEPLSTGQNPTKKDKKFAIVLLIVLSIFVILPIMGWVISGLTFGLGYFGLAIHPNAGVALGVIGFALGIGLTVLIHKAVYKKLINAFD